MYLLELKGSLGFLNFEKIIRLITIRSDEYMLDLSGITFIDPHGLAGLIIATRYCKINGSTLKVYLPQSNVQVYLAVMDFFKHVKEYQHVTQGLLSYLNFKKLDRPLLELTKLELTDGDFLSFIGFSELLDRRMEMMFKTLTDTTSKKITTNLLEICQNLEHSLDFGYVAAQKYNKPFLIKIGVMDLGIGITGALQKQFDRKGEKLTHKRAIELALKPEISSRPSGGGHGLYRLSLYVKEHAGSELIIRTGTVRCHIKHNGTKYFEGMPFFPGTQVGLTLKP
jgi:anti-anti-sigma regulatory factor